jgi:hypothetical protein
MPSYSAQRSAANAPSLRNCQPSTTQMDMNSPLFSANTLPTSVPCQAGGVFAYDSYVNPYNMQDSSSSQPYSRNHYSSLSLVPYGPHHDFSLHGNHMVRSESASSLQSVPMYCNASYTTNCNRSPSEPTEATNPRFATDVDTLMKAIQAKQTTSPQKQEDVKVSQTGTSPLWLSLRTDSS